MQQDSRRKLRRRISGSMVLKKLAQKKRLASQLRGPCIQRKQIAEFVFKYGSATRLQDNDWNARIDLRAKHAHDFFKILLGLIEQTEVVEWPAAAQVNVRNGDAEYRPFQLFFRLEAVFRMEIIIESIHPQNHLGPDSDFFRRIDHSAAGGIFPPAHQTLKTGRGKLRHFPLRRQMQNTL